MLSSLRPATRAFPRLVRPYSVAWMATPSSSSKTKDTSIANEALTHLTSTPPDSSPTLPNPWADSPSATVPSTPVDPNFFDVPPEHDPLLQFLTTLLLKDGKRSRAAKSTSACLMHIHAMTRAAPLPIMRAAVELASPAVRTMMYTQSAKVVAKPQALNERQRTRTGLMWILKASRTNRGTTVAERIAREMIAVVQGQSSLLTEHKEKAHKLAMVSRGTLPSR